MNIIGIDPGMTGGLALIGDDGIMVEPIPALADMLDIAELARWVGAHRPCMVFLEEVHAIFGSSAGATFKFGRVLGSIEGVLSALLIPYQLVQPKKWQEEIHQGIPKLLKAKERSAMAASRLFPNVDLKASARCRTAHDGMMDALLIAEYGRRAYYSRRHKYQTPVNSHQFALGLDLDRSIEGQWPMGDESQ